MKHINRILAVALVALAFASCDKENNNNDEPDTTSGATVEALVVNEGNWGVNNATITALNVANGEVVEADWFSAKNHRGLGDVAQDMVKYGTKVYAVVTFSNLAW